VTNGTIAVNRSPVAGTVPTLTNTAPAVLEIPFALLTANGTDADGDTLSVAGVSLVTTQGITLTTNGSAIFYAHNQSVTDQFSYTLGDGRGGSATGVVNIVNIAPPPFAEFTGTLVADGSSVRLHFTATPGWTYFLERSTNFADWTTLSTNVAPPSGELEFTDEFLDLGAPVSPAFYRLHWSP
jgi:hypothetical protein